MFCRVFLFFSRLVQLPELGPRADKGEGGQLRQACGLESEADGDPAKGSPPPDAPDANPGGSHFFKKTAFLTVFEPLVSRGTHVNAEAETRGVLGRRVHGAPQLPAPSLKKEEPSAQ